MILTLLYEIILIFLALLALPKMLYMLIVHKKYRKSLFKRFGRKFPKIQKGERPLIWIHAVSVGETKAIVQLVKLLKNEPGKPILLISSATETGHAEAIRSFPMADYHVYLPFDFGWIINSIVKKIAPDLVIVCESDFWLNFLKSSKNAGAKIALVNGKISERSLNRFKKVPFFTDVLFSMIDLFCLQNQHYKKRFEQLGIPSEKLHVTGNMKFDDPHPQLACDQLDSWKKQLGIQKGDQVLVAGSTHDPEEKLIIDLLPQLLRQFPHLKVVVVPRHPERFNEVEALLKRADVVTERFSKMNGNKQNVQVILIDAMGLLRQCYQLADVALVGGSFTNRVGGHNILEPCWYGVPVIFGPYMYSQPELVELANEYGSGIQVESKQLATTLQKLLQDSSERDKLGMAGKRLVQDSHGATAKTWDLLRK
jgi:3-deoxy-D-manno-octulosonic-acid transferase